MSAVEGKYLVAAMAFPMKVSEVIKADFSTDKEQALIFGGISFFICKVINSYRVAPESYFLLLEIASIFFIY